MEDDYVLPPQLVIRQGVVIRELGRVIFILFFLLVQVLFSHSSVEGVDVVIHPDVKTHTLSRNTLRAIFGMRLHRWADGTPIRVFVLKDDSSPHNEFCKERLQVFPHQLRRNWDRLVFSGIGQAPSLVQSEGEMLRRVSDTPGAIGYLNSKNVNSSVRILSVR